MATSSLLFRRPSLHGSLRAGVCAVPVVSWFTCSLSSYVREIILPWFSRRKMAGVRAEGEEERKEEED